MTQNSDYSEARKIQEWTSGFKILYSKADSTRRPEEFWNAAVAHFSSVGEAIRKNHYRELLRYAAHAFCWMCCYVSKCNDNCNGVNDLIFGLENDISQIVGFKYPRVCGHCKKMPCACEAEQIESQADKAAEYDKLLKKWLPQKDNFSTYTIQNWLDVFWDIYSGRNHLSTLESIGFHLLEEVGEEAKAVRELVQFRGIYNSLISGIDNEYLRTICEIENLVKEYTSSMEQLKRHYNVTSEKEAKENIDPSDPHQVVIKARLLIGKMGFVIELADTFSWLCAALLKLRSIIKYQNLDDTTNLSFHFEEELKNRYKTKNANVPLACYACKKTECVCVFFPEP